MELPPLICFENQDFLAINKPAGVLVHPVAADSVALSQFLKVYDAALRPAHRLDRATSGLVLCGRGPRALRQLGLLFMRGQIGKRYRARVHGSVAGESGVIDQPLKKQAARMRVDASGQSAQTRWRVIGRTASETLLELEPLTGRTHQLRAHLAHLGHPIIGDEFYGGLPSPRLWLHAWQLYLPHDLLITAPLPPELVV